jgi:gamma-glutamylcysteine synthetase
MARADLGDLGRIIERLEARGRLIQVKDWFGQDERQFLRALRGIAESGRAPAEAELALFHGRWRGRVDPVFAESAY